MNDQSPRRFIGQSVPRIEDRRFLTGRGMFIDDMTRPNMAAMAILRSPVAHGRIAALDLAAARGLPGVIDAFAASDLDHPLPVIPLRLAPFKGFERFLQRPLAEEKVRYVGEPVAVVVAESRAIAEDALDLIFLDVDPLPAVTEVEQAEAGESLVHDAAGENIAVRYDVGRGEIDEAFASADYTRKERFVTNRQMACPLETRGLIGEWRDDGRGFSLWGATKVSYFNRRHLAEAFGLEEPDVELIEVDVGGGFGARGELYPEDYLVPIAARRTGRPIKWIEDRREHLMAANHSRDITCDLEIAATADGMILGLRGAVRGDMGAYIRTNGGVVPSKTAQFLPGPYRVPAFQCEMLALATNKTPVGTYRGPGRFEANFCRERLLDMMADDLGLDPAEMRRRNLMTPPELPFRIGELVPGDADATLDKGDYPAALDRLLEEIDYDRWHRENGTIDADGRFIGIGLGCFIESSAAGAPESARLTVATDGAIELRTGASVLGQGTETALLQVAAEGLDLPMERFSIRHGTTSLLPRGGGTFHSRNTVMAGNSTRLAAETLVEKAIDLAGFRLNAAADTLSYADGAVSSASGETLTLAELAAYSVERGDGPLAADGAFDNKGKLSYSYGAHAAVVAVDADTGAVEVLKYALVEEIGRALNPAMVQGQAVGGMVQGLGGALLDHVVYGEDGQLLTTTFADYLLPGATEAPEISAIALEDSPSEFNPMGFKGAGEGGIVAVGAAIANAVNRALADTGIEILRLPLSPSYMRDLLKKAGR